MRSLLGFLFLLASLMAGVIQPAHVMAQSSAITYVPFADSYVQSDQPTTNFGTSAVVNSDGGPTTIGYFQFDTRNLAAAPTKATFKITVATGSRHPETVNGPAIYTAQSGWTETGVNYNNRPGIIGGGICDQGALAQGQTVSCDVTSLYTAFSIVTFAIQQPSNATDGTRFNSRTGNGPGPQLVLEFAAPPTNTPVPPTNTAVPTSTDTPIPPVDTATPTTVSSATPTDTPIPTLTPTLVPTNTPTPSPTTVPPTPTTIPTNTSTPLPTSTPIPPTSTPVPPTPTNTPAGCVLPVAPGQNPQTALNSATPGCTVLLLAGTHTVTAELLMANDGVTLTDEPGALLVGNIADPFGDLIVVSGDANIITGLTARTANQAIVNQLAGSVGLQVIGNDFSDAATGVQIQGQSASITGNTLHDMDREINGSNCALAHGGQAVGVLNTTGPVTVEDNTAYNNVIPSACFGTDGAFVEIFNASNVMVMGNEDSNGVTFIESAGATSGNQVHGNTISGTDSFLTLHNPANFDIQGNIVTGVTDNTYFGTGTAVAFKDNQIGGSGDVANGGQMFWLATKPANCSWSGNAYTWTDIGTFGSAGGTNYGSVAAWVAGVEACAQPTATPTPSPTPTVGPSPTPTATAVPGTAVEVIAAGDIACDTAPVTSGAFCHYGLTANLVINENPDAVLMLGDAQYETGTEALITARYNPTWGQFRNITYATAGGSHDFYGGGYWHTYFSPRAGAANQNWFSADLGNGWRLISLNSYCDQNGNCAAQTAWLNAELANNPSDCSIAMWHEPRYTSFKRHQNEVRMDSFWDQLVNGGVDIMLWGHLHNYERFAPIGTSDNADPNGMTAFIVGTGGRSLETTSPVTEPHSVVYQNTTYGVLKLTLYADHADFVFLPEPGKTFTDSGTIPCH